jgi:hypothetical protein
VKKRVKKLVVSPRHPGVALSRQQPVSENKACCYPPAATNRRDRVDIPQFDVKPQTFCETTHCQEYNH